MEVELPASGCSVFSSYNTVDHYLNNVRTRYYLYDGKLVQSSHSTYNRIPDNSYCLQSGDLVYKPEIAVYFQFMSLTIVCFALTVIFNLVIKNLWKG